jgi:hypothetical protein
VADFAIQEPDASDGGKKPCTCHIYLSPGEGEGFVKKLTGYKDMDLDGTKVLAEIESTLVDEKVKEPQKYNQKEHTLPKVSKQ